MDEVGEIMKIVGIALCLLVLSLISIGAGTLETSKVFVSEGLKQYSTKNYSIALSYFDSAIGQDPSNIVAWIYKGDTQRAMKSYNESLVS
jgi:hypothetical protein